jgi:hypothetical protein
MRSADYDRSVFVNCPLDDEYRYLLDAVVFAINDCGYVTRLAIEVSDGSEVRIDKIAKIIRECRFGFHDISRTASDPVTNLPRFNMPLELGLFLGAKRFGNAEQKLKSCLIADVERHRYQKFMSDIAGQDIEPHGGDADVAIRIVRNWLRSATPRSIRIPGGKAISFRYGAFRRELPSSCAKLHVTVDELTFIDYVTQVEDWLTLNPRIG